MFVGRGRGGMGRSNGERNEQKKNNPLAGVGATAAPLQYPSRWSRTGWLNSALNAGMLRKNINKPMLLLISPKKHKQAKPRIVL